MQRSGKTIYFSVIKLPLFDDDGNFLGIIGNSTDITVRKQKELLATENERQKAETERLQWEVKLNKVFLEKLTVEAEAEQMRLENEAYLAQKKAQAKFLTFVDKIQRDIQNYKVEALTERVGIKPRITNYDREMRLTKRELDVLYYLSLNKSPKDIAQIITIIENRSVSDSTINAIINKKLYPKFEVHNTGQLVEKAIMLNQIPFLLDN